MRTKHFYGYKHWTLEDRPRCFNVGKGQKGRERSRKNRNHKWHAIVERFGLRVELCVGFHLNEDACAWEIEQIILEKTFTINHSHDDTSDIGCNLTKGGEGSCGLKHSMLTRLNWSIKRKGVPLGPFTEEHKKNISRAKLGTKDSLEARNNKRLAHLKPETRALRSIIKSRPVVQCDDYGNILCRFKSVNEAALASGGDIGCIAACARGARKNPKHAGYVWRYLDLMKVTS